MNNQVRDKLNIVIKEQGIKLNFMAGKLGWNYQNMVSFKNGKLDYSIKRCRQLDSYLDRFDHNN